MGYWSIVERRTIRVAQANVQARQVAHAVAARVGAEVETVAVLLRAVAATVETAGTPDILIARIVDEVGSRVDSVRTIIVADDSGVVVADAGPDDPALGLDVSERRYFRVHRDRKAEGLYIGPPVRSGPGDPWAPPISVGVLDSTGAFAGVVAAAMDPAVLAEIVIESPGLGGFMARVSSAAGVLMVAPSDNGDLNPGATATSRAIDGLIDELSYSAPVVGHPLTVTVARPLAAHLTGFDGYRQRVIAAGSTAVMVVWAGIFAAGYIQARLRMEAEAARLQRDRLAETNQRLSAEMAERVAAQREAEAARHAAVEASRAKSRFLATMSHELRTPLNTIIGYSDLILTETFGPIANRRYRDYLKDIHASGRYLLLLIDDILDLSKLQGSEALSVAPVSLAPQVRAAVDFAGLRDDPRLVIAVPDDFRVLAEERALTQILVNLLSNADRHAGDASRIGVRALAAPDGRIRLEVEDDGAGIDADTLERIGQPFERSVKSAFFAPQVRGLGIGLSIVARLAELMGGDWSIHSQEGVGTSVTILLPRADH